LFLSTLNGHRRTLTKRFRWNLGKAPHLQAIAILRQLFSALPSALQGNLV
jgi:hypothetical protein